MIDAGHGTTVIGLVREQLARGASTRLRVTGSSMAPLVEPGDVVLAQRVNLADLRRGDLLLVEQGGSFLVHRLVATTGHRLQTKGDNLSHADPAVALQDVLGRVVVVEKAGRRIDLYAGRWPAVNRLLGILGWCEMHFFAIVRTAKRRLVEGRSGRWTPNLAALAAVPFRWLTRLLLLH